jgi:hypothetical protein
MTQIQSSQAKAIEGCRGVDLHPSLKNASTVNEPFCVVTRCFTQTWGRR